MVACLWWPGVAVTRCQVSSVPVALVCSWYEDTGSPVICHHETGQCLNISKWFLGIQGKVNVTLLLRKNIMALYFQGPTLRVGMEEWEEVDSWWGAEECQELTPNLFLTSKNTLNSGYLLIYYYLIFSPSYGGLGNAGNPSYAGNASMPAKFNAGPTMAARAGNSTR